jgi:hypothetical protein
MRSHFHYLLRFLTRQPNVQLDARAIRTVERLDAVSWFTHVGQPVVDGVPMLLLSSWQEAVECAISPAYDDFVLEPANELRSNVFRLAPQHARTWNAVVQVIKPHSEPLVERKIAAAHLAHTIAKTISGTVHWDMAHILLALHFQDSYRSAYYDDLLGWYLRGHFPCGWRGEYPKGEFIIY